MRTYTTPSAPSDVVSAARAIADLLDTAARSAGDALGVELATPWAGIARDRLARSHGGRAPRHHVGMGDDDLAEPEELVGKDELDEDDEMELTGDDLVDDADGAAGEAAPG